MAHCDAGSRSHPPHLLSFEFDLLLGANNKQENRHPMRGMAAEQCFCLTRNKRMEKLFVRAVRFEVLGRHRRNNSYSGREQVAADVFNRVASWVIAVKKEYRLLLAAFPQKSDLRL